MFALFSKIQGMVGWFDAHRRAERLLGGAISVMLACIVVFLLTTWKSETRASQESLEKRLDEKLALTLKETGTKVESLANVIAANNARLDRQDNALNRVIHTNEQILKKMAGLEMKVSDAGESIGPSLAGLGVVITTDPPIYTKEN